VVETFASKNQCRLACTAYGLSVSNEMKGMICQQ
jgi:hypothetical protein